jgi:tetracycline 7-halogenase / FADH2 O2-dependent halogenase
MKTGYDIVVAGSGFGGSMAAWIFRKLGLSVLLLEKGRHPRFAIGESSTPLTNLLLEELSERYGLETLRPLSKWGSWQREHPELLCGLKRGFTFYHHREGAIFTPGKGRRNQLLVAASPRDAIADTHWYRADFDHFLLRQAVEAGVEYLDQFKFAGLSFSADGAHIEGGQQGRSFGFRGKFFLDATGPRGLLHKFLGLPEVIPPRLPRSQALFSHFTGVKRLEDQPEFQAAQPAPYPVDDAAVHHLFEGGWIWVLRFCNGLTSAGVSANEGMSRRLKLDQGAAAWEKLLELFPSIQTQFAGATSVLPFHHLECMPFRSGVLTGRSWALLPSAAGFVDPLLSTGFPLTLLGIGRLAEIVENHWGTKRFHDHLQEYATWTQNELKTTELLVGALLASLKHPELFTSLSLLYFAASGFTEMSRRVKRPENAPGFLLHQHPHFGPAMNRICLEVLKKAEDKHLEKGAIHLLRHSIGKLIGPFDLFGLTEPGRDNWHPALPAHLPETARKLRVSETILEEMLLRCGFASRSPFAHSSSDIVR